MFGRTLVDVETLEPYTDSDSAVRPPSPSLTKALPVSLEVFPEDNVNEVPDDYFCHGTYKTGTLPEHVKHSFHSFSASCEECPPATSLDFPSSEGLTLRQYYETFIHRTPEQCRDEFLSPQRSEAWKLARKFSLTASDFGAASGNNSYDSPDDLLKKKLHVPFQGNAATQWGCAMEPRAAEAFLQFAKSTLSSTSKLYDVNLVKYSSSSWLAVSPDNVLYWKDSDGKEHWDLVEYKCPTRASHVHHPYKKYEGNIPPYYKCQMLGIWGHCNDNQGIYIRLDSGEIIQKYLDKVWFVVWQPKCVWITHYTPSLEEWRDLHKKLRAWYFERFLPSLYNLTSTISKD
jgi:putative phage-type endonuclease